jgi:hypothetical protein
LAARGCATGSTPCTTGGQRRQRKHRYKKKERSSQGSRTGDAKTNRHQARQKSFGDRADRIIPHSNAHPGRPCAIPLAEREATGGTLAAVRDYRRIHAKSSVVPCTIPAAMWPEGHVFPEGISSCLRFMKAA